MNIDFAKKSKKELILFCKNNNIKKYSSLNRNEIIELIKSQKNNILKPNDLAESISLFENLSIKDVSDNINSQQFFDELKLGSLRFIDLFCGIGGFHQAFKNIDSNSKCVFACDIDESCRKIYEKNYGLKPEGDITKVDISKIPPFDVLCGGFPCQPFSKAGFQKGFDDDRGNLFFNICDIVKEHKPKYMLLENVRNLSSHDDGNTWKVIKKNINELGYYTYDEPTILNVLHFNVPQNRERVIIMCKRKDLGPLPILPEIPKDPKKNLTCVVKDIIDSSDKSNKSKLNEKMKVCETVWNNFLKVLKSSDITVPKFPIWTDWWDNDLNDDIDFYHKYKNWIDKNREFYITNQNILQPWLNTSRGINEWKGAVRKFEWQAGDLLKSDSMNTVLWSARGSGIRVKRPDYIPTLVAMSMIPIYGPESRLLNPRELLRLQSFPDSFEYDEKTIYKQVGNAVNVKMIEHSLRFLVLNEGLL